MKHELELSAGVSGVHFRIRPVLSRIGFRKRPVRCECIGFRIRPVHSGESWFQNKTSSLRVSWSQDTTSPLRGDLVSG